MLGFAQQVAADCAAVPDTTSKGSAADDLLWKERADHYVSTWNILAVVNVMVFAAAMTALFSGAPPNPGVALKQYTPQTTPGQSSDSCSVSCTVPPDLWFTALWGATAAWSLMALMVCCSWAGVLLRCHTQESYSEFAKCGQCTWGFIATWLEFCFDNLSVLCRRLSIITQRQLQAVRDERSAGKKAQQDGADAKPYDLSFWPGACTACAMLVGMASLLYSLQVFGAFSTTLYGALILSFPVFAVLVMVPHFKMLFLLFDGRAFF